jgi:hypothetical protein
MNSPFQQIDSYKKHKIKSIIWAGKCFFVLHLYNLTASEIDTLKEKTEPLGLRLIRFPLANLHQASTLPLRNVTHLPMQISNYILLGKQNLGPGALSKLHTTLEEHRAVLIFGYQDQIWFNGQRLLKEFEVNTESSTKVLRALESYFQACHPVQLIPGLSYQLISNLEALPIQLK